MDVIGTQGDSGQGVATTIAKSYFCINGDAPDPGKSPKVQDRGGWTTR